MKTNTEPTAIEKLKEIKANGYQDDDAPDGHGIVPDFVWGFMNKTLSEAERKAFGAGRYQIRKYKTIEDYQKLNGAKI